ncbi:hypothetical protein ACSBR2_007187 [Camellia fascicularis]
MKHTLWGDVEMSQCVMKILSWNIRRLGKKGKQGKIRKLLKERNVDMVLLQETKKPKISEVEIRSMWLRDKMEFLTVDSEGSAGGLLCVWDPDVFQISESCSNRRFILLSGALPGFVDQLLLWWAGGKMEMKIWSAISLAVLWSIWKLRNECIFKSSTQTGLSCVS